MSIVFISASHPSNSCITAPPSMISIGRAPDGVPNAVMMIPTAKAHGDKSHARFDEPAGEQETQSRFGRAVLLFRLAGFLGDVERLAGSGRADHGVGALIELVHRTQRLG